MLGSWISEVIRHLQDRRRRKFRALACLGVEIGDKGQASRKASDLAYSLLRHFGNTGIAIKSLGISLVRQPDHWPRNLRGCTEHYFVRIRIVLAEPLPQHQRFQVRRTFGLTLRELLGEVDVLIRPNGDPPHCVTALHQRIFAIG